MYSTEINLTSNIVPPVIAANRVSLRNYNSQNTLSEGAYLVVILNYNGYKIEEESQAGLLIDFVTDAGTLSASVTGLESTFNYSYTRTGWIYIHDGIDYQKCRVKQYVHSSYDTDANDASSVLKVLSIASNHVAADYEWADTISGWDASGVINTVIEGAGYISNATGIDIGNDGTTIQASYTITAADTSNLMGNHIFLTTSIRKNNAFGDLIETISGSGSGTGTIVSTSTSIITASEIDPAERIWVKTEISDLGIQ